MRWLKGTSFIWLQESNGWGFGFGFENGSEIERTTSYHSNPDKDLHKEENGSVSFPSNTNVTPGGSSWAFSQPSLDTGNEKEVLYHTVQSTFQNVDNNFFSGSFEMKSSDFWW